jgi:hypothetical protein
MEGLMGMMGGGQPPQPGAGGPPAAPQGPDPNQILQQMLGGKVPPMPNKPPKKKLEVKDEKKNTTPATPSGKLQKARDMIKAVVNEMGAQSDIASGLSGIVRNLDMQIKKLGGADMTQDQISGLGDTGKPPLGVGTPGQTLPDAGGGMMSPTNPTTLTANLQGAPVGGQF